MPRQKNYQRDEVVQKATDLFWRKGFEATSVNDLVKAMGMNRFSLYEEFGSKDALFQVCLTTYRGVMSRRLMDPMAHDEDGVRGIYGVFDYLIAAYTSSNKGCLITNTTLERANRDANSRAQVRRHFRRFEAAFVAAIAQARADGRIGSTRSDAELACFLTMVVQGITVDGVAFCDGTRLRGQTEAALAVLELKP